MKTIYPYNKQQMLLMGVHYKALSRNVMK